MPVQNWILTAEPQRAQRKNFLFGVEPLDRLKALRKVEGIPPNKKASALSIQASSYVLRQLASPILFPKEQTFCSNCRLQIGAEEKLPLRSRRLSGEN